MRRRLLRREQVLDKFAVSKSWLYEGMRLGIFPLPVKPDPNSTAVRWDEAECDEVIEQRLAARDGAANGKKGAA